MGSVIHKQKETNMFKNKLSAVAMCAAMLAVSGVASAQQAQQPPMSGMPDQSQPGVRPGMEGLGAAHGMNGMPGREGPEMSEEDRAAIAKLTPAQKSELRGAMMRLKSDREQMRADFESFQALRAKYGLPEMHRPMMRGGGMGGMRPGMPGGQGGYAPQGQ